MTRSTFRTTLLAGVLGLFAAPAGADDPARGVKVDLKVGDAAPAFEARTDADKTWASADHFGKKWVVVYFYPGDFTPGCTAQVKAFKDAMEKLAEKGVEVVGVSGDSVEIHAKFKEAQKLNFTLLADPDGAVAKEFGVPVGKGGKVKARDADKNPVEFDRAVTLARWTFLVGRDGTVAYKNTKVHPADDAKQIAAFLAAAEAGK